MCITSILDIQVSKTTYILYKMLIRFGNVNFSNLTDRSTITKVCIKKYVILHLKEYLFT